MNLAKAVSSLLLLTLTVCQIVDVEGSGTDAEISCSAEKFCPGESFCNHDSGDEGFCEDCRTIRDCFHDSLTPGGEQSCAAICPNYIWITCSEDVPCPYDRFCNYDFGGEGFCEYCGLDLDCYNRDLPYAGAQACADTCVRRCSANKSCPHGSFCNYDLGEKGSCEECDTVNDCFHDNLPHDGEQSCADICPQVIWITCSEDVPCPDGRFCNYDFGDEGFCEYCGLDVDCFDRDFHNDAGAKECSDVCGKFEPLQEKATKDKL